MLGYLSRCKFPVSDDFYTWQKLKLERVACSPKGQRLNGESRLISGFHATQVKAEFTLNLEIGHALR